MEPLSLQVEWESGEGVRHPALAGTWARLSFSVGERIPTTVREARTGGTRSGVYGPAFLLAEWVVKNFAFLLHESAPAGPIPEQWLQRHSLLAAREGTSFPDLRFWRDEDRIAVQWVAVPESSSRPVAFVESGEARLRPTEVLTPLVGVVDLVLDHLRDCDHPDVAALRADWEATTSATGDEKKLLERAARMGLDAFDDATVDQLEGVLLGGLDDVPEATRDDLLDGGVAPTRIAPTVGLVAETLRNGIARPVLSSGAPRNRIDRLPDATRAYEQGYAVARDLRSAVRLRDGALDLRALELELGWEGLRDESRRNWTEVDSSLQALVGMSPEGFPRVILDPRRTDRHSRFVRARSLYFLLSGATTAAPRLVTSGGTWLQASSRAFAAELLAPADQLLARADRLADEECVDQLADEFNVSSSVINHQLDNHGAGR